MRLSRVTNWDCGGLKKKKKKWCNTSFHFSFPTPDPIFPSPVTQPQQTGIKTVDQRVRILSWRQKGFPLGLRGPYSPLSTYINSQSGLKVQILSFRSLFSLCAFPNSVSLQPARVSPPPRRSRGPLNDCNHSLVPLCHKLMYPLPTAHLPCGGQLSSFLGAPACWPS